MVSGSLWLLQLLTCASLLLATTAAVQPGAEAQLDIEGEQVSSGGGLLLALQESVNEADGVSGIQEVRDVQASSGSRRRRRSTTTAAPTQRRRRRRGNRRRRSSCPPYSGGDECPCEKFSGSCPEPCSASKKCKVCNVWNDIIEEHDDENKAQFGDGFPDPWSLMASHQCFNINECILVKDEDGESTKMAGNAFNDTMYETVKFGRKCRGEPAGGWGNLGKCSTWKDCFKKCLSKNNDEESDWEQNNKKKKVLCNLLHYEVETGQCTSFTEKECQKDDKYYTKKADGFVVMRAYKDDEVARQQAARNLERNQTA